VGIHLHIYPKMNVNLKKRNNKIQKIKTDFRQVCKYIYIVHLLRKNEGYAF
jgi:hypothetical protein